MSDKKYEMDMCSGALFPKIIAFALPLAVSGILQLLFNAADIVVVGRFVGKEALAAVGSTTAFINFIINLFMGLSVGAGVVVANCYGAGEKEALKESVHTAVMLSFVGGISLTVLGLLVSRPILSAMGNPPDVLDLSVLYIRIYFLSIPGLLFYNFGSAILRAAGDTKRPMYFLFAAGVLNVFLNIFFVVVMGLGVDGVAYATGISQYLSGFLVLYTLVRSDSDYKLILKEIKMYKYPTIKILKIGIPAGFQGMVFSLSNMLIQSSVNSFGSTAMAGNAAAQNVEGFVYVSMTAVYQTAMNFVSQNFGAHKFDRIKKIHFETLVLVFITGIVGGWAVYILCDKILLLYTANDKVISVAKLRLSVILTTYALCGAMDVMSGILRGLGHSSLPMVVSFLGACAFRVVWVLTVFTFVKRTLMALYISYPLSWAITFIIHTICYYFIIDYYKDKKF
ncbi:MATE family efflux transporter [Treponema parvum]|uniref:MATE family efflux transporter n=1 Tax=Treponema parvum TaxID=138851 RepID=A0A975EYU9_9SPIR|nr:MATE family efflux transporter [Treponema parvum]QTQ11450.1 MATE family efflux transporter [Treponema parvum]